MEEMEGLLPRVARRGGGAGVGVLAGCCIDPQAEGGEGGMGMDVQYNKI